ncbi:MAG: Txe/YoeB family addiction module toxin [Puniceicoccales bacterium]|nr:Txe/YoeB family addiction module toxin [Puniceicoccales bacterium]
MDSWNKFSRRKSFRKDLEKLVRVNEFSAKSFRELLLECLEHPRTGTGSPESLSGFGTRKVWSRRTVVKHRLVYEITSDSVIFFRCHGHYDDH